jgi:hypothetical protein
MAKKASAEDAHLILKLYELKREAEMRKARNWWVMEFWPASAEDFMKVAQGGATQESKWMRQVTSYWGIAASFVLEGVLNEELFLRPAFSGELFLMFGKVHPFLNELREKMNEPQLFGDIEEVISQTKWGRERLKFVLKRLEQWRERIGKKA